MTVSCRRKTVLSIAVFLCLASFSLAAAEKPLFDYHESKLANGLTVVTLEDFSCPLVTVQVWYQAGSKDERPDRQGYAHLFEHMMFKGTDRVGTADYSQWMQRAGGYDNAFTDMDETVYWQTLPAGQLELALWLEAERMAFLKIDQENFDTERRVVEEELRVSENAPYGNLDKKLLAAVFKEHPYHWDTIGNLAHLRATRVADLRAFWQTYYVPGNASLIIVGAVKHEDVVKLAEKYLGWIQSRPLPLRITARAPLPDKSQTLLIDDENAPAPLVRIVFRTVPASHKDTPALDFLAAILGGTSNSRLYRDLVAEKQLAVQTSAGNWSLQLDGLFSIETNMAPGSDPKPVIEKIKSHIEAIQKEGITQEELETARNQQLRSVVTGNLRIESKARALGSAVVIAGDLSYANKILSQIRSVTADDVKRVAGSYLQLNRALEITVKENPEGMKAASKDDESAVRAEPEKQTPPPGRPDEKRPDTFPAKAPLALPQAPDVTMNYTEQTLKNGLKIIVVQNHEAPFVTVKFALPFGAAAESKPGTANLTLQMLTRGTKTRTEKQLAEQLAHYAIEIDGGASKDDAQVNLSCLSEHLEKGMELLADSTANPTFDSAQFDKLRKQTLADLAVEEKNPRYLANREFSRRLFGQHPYARTVQAQSDDIEKLTAADLKTWWTQYNRRDNSILLFAGDIDAPKAFALAEKYFGGSTHNTPMTALEMPAFPLAEKTQIYLVDYPGSAQAQIRVGCRSINRKDLPDYYVSRVVSTYFGGVFNSWVNKTLREEKGLTYHAYAGYSAQRQSGYFELGTFTKNESVKQAIDIILDLISQLRSKEPPVDQFNDSKQFIYGSFIRRYETPQQIADELWLLESEKLDSNFYKHLIQTVQNTSAQDCVKLAQKTLDPEKLIIVVVGDAGAIKADLEKIAPVSVVGTKSK